MLDSGLIASTEVGVTVGRSLLMSSSGLECCSDPSVIRDWPMGYITAGEVALKVDQKKR